jgi:predicted transcriptional regulator
MSVKEAALHIVSRLGTECTWDEVLYEIYVCRRIEAGLKAEAEGRIIPHERVFAKYAKKKKAPSGVGRARRK